MTALRFSAQYGHLEITQFLLSKGADPNIRAHDGFDPLMSAVEKGEKEICALLLDRGANVRTKTRLATPLMIAKEKGHGEVEKLLVSQNFKYSKRWELWLLAVVKCRQLMISLKF